MAGSLRHRVGMSAPILFLLSPANCGGKRAAILSRPEAEFDLATRFRTQGAPIGEVFAFLSGLYFRGKLAYARRFGRAAAHLPSGLVITSNRGLVPPDSTIGPADLASFASVSIDIREDRYTEPLRRSVSMLSSSLHAEHRVVLLGSVATSKYVEILIETLGDGLLIPEPFPGMGDMQRGAMMLRAAEAGEELAYVSATAVLRSRAQKVRRKSRSG